MSVSDTDKPNSLPRKERLRGRSSVSRLFSEGCSGFVYPLRYIWMDGREGSDCDSVLFTVPKRFHKRANRRNLLRRRIKECYRLNRPLLQGEQEAIKGLNIAIIYSSKEELEYSRIERSICRLLTQIAQESGRMPKDNE